MTDPDRGGPINTDPDPQHCFKTCSRFAKYYTLYVATCNFDWQVGQYISGVVQTISNPDGTVSIVHVDPNNPVITLPDGTQAQVRLEGAHKSKISYKIAMFPIFL
jgi:hypothetical protein